MSDLENFEFIYRAGRVKRYHVETIIGEQTVADHSWGVANLLLEIFKDFVSRDLLLAALWHDVPERTTGDTPATAKWLSYTLRSVLENLEEEIIKQKLPDYPDLFDDQKLMLKIADISELIYFCTRQVRMGNVYCDEIIYRGLDYLCGLDVSSLCPQRQEHFDQFLEELKDYVTNQTRKENI